LCVYVRVEETEGVRELERNIVNVRKRGRETGESNSERGREREREK
jgi:hypothetical protein